MVRSRVKSKLRRNGVPRGTLSRQPPVPGSSPQCHSAIPMPYQSNAANDCLPQASLVADQSRAVPNRHSGSSETEVSPVEAQLLKLCCASDRSSPLDLAALHSRFYWLG